MPQCTFHPSVETDVSCVQCGRYMCPKDFVSTPVGYKCKECARQLPSARRTVKPKQLVLAALVAVAVGIGGALLVRLLGYGFVLIPVIFGMLTGEAARRASGGHRETVIAMTAGAGVLIGCLVIGLGPLATVLGTGAAVASVLWNRW